MQDIVISKNKFLDLLARGCQRSQLPRPPPRARRARRTADALAGGSAEGAAMVGLISAHLTRAERTGHCDHSPLARCGWPLVERPRTSMRAPAAGAACRLYRHLAGSERRAQYTRHTNTVSLMDTSTRPLPCAATGAHRTSLLTMTPDKTTGLDVPGVPASAGSLSLPRPHRWHSRKRVL